MYKTKNFKILNNGNEHAWKLLVEILLTFFVTIYFCEFLYYLRQIFNMNRYVHGKGNYRFDFLVFGIFGGKVTSRIMGENLHFTF